MAITLSYNGDLSRVQIQGTSLAVDEVHVERSTNEMLWLTVRGGLFIPVDGGQIDLDDFEFDSDTENFYRILDTDNNVIESDSITPSLAGEVWWKSIRHPFLNRAVRLLDRQETIGRGFRGTVSSVSGRSTPTAVTDLRDAREFELSVMVDDLTAARDLDLILASGDVFFVHVPDGSIVPGGYVVVDASSSQQRLYRGDPAAQHVFTLPCKVVTPPGPDLVGTNLTWGTVFRLYGDWTALINANPTWRDLLATVGSPDDLVVL